MSKSTVIIQMDGNYPDISSGIVSFENTRTGTKISIKAPEDLESGIYGIKSITMDSGAGYTILPESFATLLDISRPNVQENKYISYAVEEECPLRLKSNGTNCH